MGHGSDTEEWQRLKREIADPDRLIREILTELFSGYDALPIDRYNVAPSTRVQVLHSGEDGLLPTLKNDGVLYDYQARPSMHGPRSRLPDAKIVAIALQKSLETSERADSLL